MSDIKEKDVNVDGANVEIETVHRTHEYLDSDFEDGVIHVFVEVKLECDCGNTLTLNSGDDNNKNCEECGCLWKIKS